jgi:epoxide hydrolase 4
MTMHAAIAHGTAAVNGVRLHVAHAGGHGPHVLFLHGFPETWRLWRPQLEDLGRDHRAVAIDLRGYGDSDRPRPVSAYRLPVLVEDVRALAAHLGAERLALVGHDWGGLIAWEVARRHPDLVSRLVILNAPHPATYRRELRRNGRQRAASAYALALQVPGAERVLAMRDFRLLRRATFATDPRPRAEVEADERAYMEAWSRPGALRAMVSYYRAAARDAVRAAMRGRAPHGSGRDTVVRAPTLVLWGERDPFLLDSNLDGLERHAPDLTVRRVPDATQWIVRERAALVTDEIRRFLATPDRS